MAISIYSRRSEFSDDTAPVSVSRLKGNCSRDSDVEVDDDINRGCDDVSGELRSSDFRLPSLICSDLLTDAVRRATITGAAQTLLNARPRAQSPFAFPLPFPFGFPEYEEYHVSGGSTYGAAHVTPTTFSASVEGLAAFALVFLVVS